MGGSHGCADEMESLVGELLMERKMVRWRVLVCRGQRNVDIAGVTARQYSSSAARPRCIALAPPTTFGYRLHQYVHSSTLSENYTHFSLNKTIRSVMPREAEPSLSERTFILKALEEGLRIDNRKLDEGRPVVLSLGDDYGVADVKFGKTRHVIIFLEAAMVSPQSSNKILCTESLQKYQPR